jgi:hypothetical protein
MDILVRQHGLLEAQVHRVGPGIDFRRVHEGDTEQDEYESREYGITDDEPFADPHVLQLHKISSLVV